MSEPITLTERERAVFGSMIEYVRERCKNWTAQDGKVSGNAVSRWMEDWLSKQPAESASPPRVPGASAHPLWVGVESGPGQPIDICERMNRARDYEPNAELRMILAEGEMEIRRLRAEVEPLRDPAMLHANLLRGFPATLTQEQRLHLVGSAKIDEIRADGFRAGIEAAARWHDEKADFCARNFGDEDIGAKMIREDHREYAGAIRALADKPAPDAARKGG